MLFIAVALFWMWAITQMGFSFGSQVLLVCCVATLFMFLALRYLKQVQLTVSCHGQFWTIDGIGPHGQFWQLSSETVMTVLYVSLVFYHPLSGQSLRIFRLKSQLVKGCSRDFYRSLKLSHRRGRL